MTRPEWLYPFLDSDPEELDKVLTEAAHSTEDKAREIATLRQDLVARLGARIDATAHAMAASFASGARLFTFGNGGSSTDAASLAARFLNPGVGARALPAMSLTADVALVTALTNDIGFEVVFARQLAALGRDGDIALALSTSGGSVNVLRGLEQAHQMGMLTIGLAGSGGGAMAESHAVDCLLAVPSVSVHRIQEAQTTIYHVLWELTQQALAGAG
jgi:D-sedoheptulose 7-phosphate isomerase